MKPILKIILIAVGAIAALALVVRETGLIDFNFFKSRSAHRSNWNSQSASVPMVLSPGRRTEIETWQREPLPGFYERELCFVETSELPWSRWLPLVKIGTAKVSRRFVVLANGGEVMSGETSATVDLTVIGSMSARAYGRRAAEAERKAFVDWLATQARKGPANFPPAQSSPVVVRKNG